MHLVTFFLLSSPDNSRFSFWYHHIMIQDNEISIILLCSCFYSFIYNRDRNFEIVRMSSEEIDRHEIAIVH